MNLRVEDLDIRACYTADAFSIWAERVRKGYLTQTEWRNQTYSTLMLFYSCLLDTISVRYIEIAKGAAVTAGVWEMIVEGITCVSAYCRRPMFAYLIKLGVIHQHGAKYSLYRSEDTNKTTVLA